MSASVGTMNEVWGNLNAVAGRVEVHVPLPFALAESMLQTPEAVTVPSPLSCSVPVNLAPESAPVVGAKSTALPVSVPVAADGSHHRDDSRRILRFSRSNTLRYAVRCCCEPGHDGDRSPSSACCRPQGRV